MKDKFPTFAESGNPSRESYLECYAFHLECQLKRARDAAKIIDPPFYQQIADAARAVGYAVGVHGSRARDIDLMAMPWIDEAVSAAEVAKAIADAVGGFVRTGCDRFFQTTDKPHGRCAVHILLKDGTIIDLSIMPRLKPRVSAEQMAAMDNPLNAGKDADL